MPKYDVNNPRTYDKNNPQHHTDFLKRPDLWPNWPLCPIYKGDYPDREFAVLHASGKIAKGVNMFRMQGNIEWENTTPEQAVAEGWRVD